MEIARTDRDINIQVRGTYLNVYCKMGNLLKIYMNGKKVACAVHYKYLELVTRRNVPSSRPSCQGSSRSG